MKRIANSAPGDRAPRAASPAVSTTIAACLAWLSCGPPPPEPPEALLEGSALGTRFSVRIAADLEPQELEEAVATIGNELGRVDALMSTYRPDSEISGFNAERSREPYPMSEETIAILEEAQGISEASGGAFDVTVGPLVDLWGFGPEGLDQPPDEDALSAVLPRVGWRLLDVDRRSGTLTKAVPDLEVDLSAIGKGYAVDRVTEALVAAGWPDVLVEIGGEIRAAGRSPRGTPWRVGIETPETIAGGIARRIELVDRAMATSGDYRNFYVVDGRRISHTIDPRSGRPVTHSGASVTVLAERCATADAWATALLVLGPEQGYGLAEELGLAAHFQIYDGDGGVSERSTPAFEGWHGPDSRIE